MAESFKEISFEEAKNIEDIDKILQEKLGISLSECAGVLSDSLQERAGEIVEDLPNIAPYGDYGKLIEDPETITKFLREEAAKPDNWEIELVEVKKDKLIELMFFNRAVDDGDILKGFVFVGRSGKIRHAFAQVNS